MVEEIIRAIILGLVQGITEFLPISSSGHLEIFNKILSQKHQENMTMTVVLHFATALSTLVVFKTDVFSIFNGLIKKKDQASVSFSIKILLSMIPAAIIGLIFKDDIEKLFQGNLLLVGGMLLFTGLLLLLADKSKTNTKNVSYKSAFTIGFSQAIALLPGVSRAGSTIATSVILGIDKEKSAKFSFLMVIPLIFGMMIKSIFDGDIVFNSSEFVPILIGFLFAFVTGLFACKLMIRLVKNSKLIYFSFYCFIVGGVLLITEIL